ncbi:MAG: flavin reductase [Clostridium sp.]|nr:flavin reductase [Clostridium sp.]
MKNKSAMFALSYGLFVLTARRDDWDSGCIINTAAQVTTTPNRVVITVNKDNYTHNMVMDTGRFNLSVIAEDAPFALFQRFGFLSGRDADKFAGFEAHTGRGENGLTYVTQGTNAYLSCKVVSSVDLGTHTMFLADVEDGDMLSSVPSATYAYYHAHIKPKPQAPAAPAAEGKKRWVCKICGWIYEGDELPDDLVCPICKHGAQDFELMT